MKNLVGKEKGSTFALAFRRQARAARERAVEKQKSVKSLNKILT